MVMTNRKRQIDHAKPVTSTNCMQLCTWCTLKTDANRKKCRWLCHEGRVELSSLHGRSPLDQTTDTLSVDQALNWPEHQVARRHIQQQRPTCDDARQCLLCHAYIHFISHLSGWLCFWLLFKEFGTHFLQFPTPSNSNGLQIMWVVLINISKNKFRKQIKHAVRHFSGHNTIKHWLKKSEKKYYIKRRKNK